MDYHPPHLEDRLQWCNSLLMAKTGYDNYILSFQIQECAGMGKKLIYIIRICPCVYYIPFLQNFAK